ncbi:BTAD domain-containing putative transcriptional regulator [Kitasatospora sp. NPDC056531]|uniref:AfsR/SARP family transcriptional regulator n=1 Tax=Kitasatospora sp. NPDC056531 TaxID=3345856 RepID=UPI00367F4ED8
MRLELLGPMRTWIRGEQVLIGPPKQRAVLGLLASRVNEVVGIEQIVNAVWGDAVPPSVLNGVHTYVAGLRRVLEPDRGPRESGGVLVSASGGYALRMDAEAVDIERFVRGHAQARRLRAAQDVEGAVRAYEDALALWHGDAYANVPGPFAEMERVRLQELKVTAGEEWAESLLAAGRHTESVTVLSDLVLREPLRERLRWLLMLALYRGRRRAHALEVYRETRRLLDDELGIEPGPELRSLHEQILGGHPDLDLPTPAPASALAAARPVAPAEPPGAPPGLAAVPTPVQLPPAARGFTGRSAELARLRHVVLLERLRPAAFATVAVVEGAPGIGKTALALRLAHQVSDRFPDGQLFVDLCGSAPDREPLSAIKALAQLLRSLGVPDEQMPEDVPGRAALYRSLLHDRRVLVVFDDALTAEQVRPLIPRGPSCAVITSRRKLHGLAALDGAYRIGLAPLAPEASLELLGYLIGEQAQGDGRPAAARLAQLCGNLPLALRIAAEGLMAQPRLTLEELVQDHTAEHSRLDRLAVEGDVAASLRTAFAASLRLLPADAARTFQLLGMCHDMEITAAAAAALTGRDEEWAARQLATLADSHLLEEAGRDLYRFHSLIGLYAAECAESVLSEHRTAALNRLLRPRPVGESPDDPRPTAAASRPRSPGTRFR